MAHVTTTFKDTGADEPSGKAKYTRYLMVWTALFLSMLASCSKSPEESLRERVDAWDQLLQSLPKEEKTAISLIVKFLEPSDRREEQAKTFFTGWAAQQDAGWKRIATVIERMSIDRATRTGTVRHRNGIELEDGSRLSFFNDAEWKDIDGVWYRSKEMSRPEPTEETKAWLSKSKKECANNLTFLWAMHFARQKPICSKTGADFWLELNRTKPPLINDSSLDTFVCPASGRKQAKGFTNYRGPAEDIGKAGSELLNRKRAVGCCFPGSHLDGTINVLLLDGEVRETRIGDPLLSEAISRTSE